MTTDTDFNLADAFDIVARAVSDRAAVIHRGRVTTYAELLARSTRFANVLTAANVGSRVPRSQLQPWESGQGSVALCLHNGVEFLEAMIGSWAARAAPFNVNYRYVPAEMHRLFVDARPDVVVFHSTYAETVLAAVEGLSKQPMLLQVWDEDVDALRVEVDGVNDYHATLRSVSAVAPAIERSPDDLYILYTGGTTGEPKGTLWRQGDVFATFSGFLSDGAGAAISTMTPSDLAETVRRLPTTKTMPLCPFIHGGGQRAALPILYTGSTVVLPDETRRFDPANACRIVDEYHVDTIVAVGEAFLLPLADEIATGSHDLGSVSRIMSGGASMNVRTMRRLLDLLPSITVRETCGASEAVRGLSRTTIADVATPQGFATDSNTVVVADDFSRVLPPTSDEEGWLATSGHLPLAYLGDPDKSASTFRGVENRRFAITGDRARWLPGGRIDFLGRASSTINTGGEKVFAEEVEQALLAHVAVRDVVVVGRTSERWGQEVVAIVALDPAATIDDSQLLDATSTRLARYKLPKSIVRVSEIRRSTAGKPDYGWARATAELSKTEEVAAS